MIRRLPSVSQTAASSPVQLEGTGGVGDRGAVERQGLGGGGGGREVDETVAGIASATKIRLMLQDDEFIGYLPRELVTDHLHVDLLAHLEPQVTDEVLVNPRLEFTHPIRYQHHPWHPTVWTTATHARTYQRVVFPSTPCWDPVEGSPGVGPWKGAGDGSA